jgi:hypothetical protein
LNSSCIITLHTYPYPIHFIYNCSAQIRAADSTEQYIDAFVELENISQWTSAISQWMQQQCGTEKVSLFGLQQALGMPLVEVWLGLLLSKERQYEWEKSGDFYDDATKVWISSKLPSSELKN